MNNKKEVGPLLSNWLYLRKKLLIAYTNLCNEVNLQKSDNLQTQTNIFFENLIDYIILGQLKIFNHILEARVSIHEATEENNRLVLNQLLQTTIAASKLNDMYSNLEEKRNIIIKQDLSQIGMIINKRLELEDILIHNNISQNELS